MNDNSTGDNGKQSSNENISTNKDLFLEDIVPNIDTNVNNNGSLKHHIVNIQEIMEYNKELQTKNKNDQFMMIALEIVIISIVVFFLQKIQIKVIIKK